MTGHQTYFSYLPGVSHFDPTEWANWEKIIAALCLGLVLLAVGTKAASNIRSAESREKAIVPSARVTLSGFFDLFVEGFVGFYDSILGAKDRRHLPFVASVFIFILSANLLGLVPGMPAITTTVWVNVAMALAVFGYFNWQGIQAHGVKGYLKHFCGPLWWLAWFMFPLEVVSTCLRVLTLNLRLYWNITGDHLVLGVFTEMLPPVVPVIFYVLGTFVCFMQAFVFTTLTMVYILLATQHDEEHEEHEKHAH